MWSKRPSRVRFAREATSAAKVRFGPGCGGSRSASHWRSAVAATRASLMSSIRSSSRANGSQSSRQLRRLPTRKRLVVFLRYFADLSYAEIAEIGGISEGTVAAALSQARAALLEQLSAKEVKR